MFCTLLLSFFFTSCIDNEEHYASYGVIQNVNSLNDYRIFTDKGNLLLVTKSPSGYAIEENKRVLVNYDILSEKSNASPGIYEVKVNGFYHLLSKPEVRESFILEDEEARRDSIGNDPFCGLEAWFGGDYININFVFLHSGNSSIKHLINLVYDDTRTGSDTVFLSLKHNAYDDGLYDYGFMKGMGRCSFNLANIVPASNESTPIRLSWIQYKSGSMYEDYEEVCFKGTFIKPALVGTYYGKNIGEPHQNNTFDNTVEVK